MTDWFLSTDFLGGMCGKLESVTVEVLSPVMSTSTPTDEGETTEEPVVVVSCCGGGKVVYQYCKTLERHGVLHEEYAVGIGSSGFSATLSIHTHLLQLYCLRGSVTCIPLSNA